MLVLAAPSYSLGEPCDLFSSNFDQCNHDGEPCTLERCDPDTNTCVRGDKPFCLYNDTQCQCYELFVCGYKTCILYNLSGQRTGDPGEAVTSKCEYVHINGAPAPGCIGPANEMCMEKYCSWGSCATRQVSPCCNYNGTCDPGAPYFENTSFCCEDCPCSGGQYCFNNACTNFSSSILGSTLTVSAWSAWVPLALIALIIGYMLVALLIMAASFLHSPELHAYARREFVEVSVSVWFVGSIIFFVFLLNTLIQDLATVGGEDYMSIAQGYTNRVSADILAAFGKTVKAQFGIGLVQYLGGGAGFGACVGKQCPKPEAEGQAGAVVPPVIPLFPIFLGFSFSFAPFYGLSIISNIINTGSNLLSLALFSMIGQFVLLQFISETMFKIFLPVGIVLRSFTLTRKLGATIMAVAIGAYVVYPLTLVMNSEMYSSVLQMPREEYWGALPLKMLDMGDITDAFQGPRFSKYCDKWWKFPWCFLLAIIMWVWSMVRAFIEIIAFVLVMIASVFYPGVGEVAASGFDYYADAVPWMMQPMVAALFFPILDLIIVVTAMRSLSTALGGEARITGLAEFI
ncbi:MAG: hypothetical protein AB1468_01425 [Candidatus Micrarchaeota archaeon]